MSRKNIELSNNSFGNRLKCLRLKAKLTFMKTAGTVSGFGNIPKKTETIEHLIEPYLEWVKKHQAPSTYEGKYRLLYGPILSFFRNIHPYFALRHGLRA